MEVQLLAPIARNACNMEDLEPQSKGEFLRTLCLCAELNQDRTQLLFEYMLDELLECQLLESCEFHEGLDEILEPSRMVEIIVGAYSRVSNDELSRVISVLCSSSILKLDPACWRFIRSNMSPSEFRIMLTRIIEMTCDRVDQIGELLQTVYKKEEEFEIADSIRLVLESHWILDIIPQKRKKARRVIEEFFLHPFPFAKQYVDTFLVETLRFEDIDIDEVPEDVPAEKDVPAESSSDSDVESRGSLEDFVVDDSEEEEDLSSASSEESLPARKSSRRKYSSSSSSR